MTFNNYQPQGYQQQSQQPAQAEAAPSFSSLLKSGGGKSAFNANTPQGYSVSGTVENVTTRQKQEFGTGKPMFSKTGKPKYEALITILTSLCENPDDDGRRTVYIDMWGAKLDAMREACSKAGVECPSVGDTFSAKFVGYGTPQPGMSAPKLYEYRIEHKTPAPVNFTNGQQPDPQQAQQSTQGAQGAQPAQTMQPAQAASQVNPQQIMQLLAQGKQPQEITGLLGCTAQQVQAAMDEMSAMFGQSDEF